MNHFETRTVVLMLLMLTNIIGTTEKLSTYNKSWRVEDNWARELALADNSLNSHTVPVTEIAEPRLLKAKKHKAHKISKKNKLSKESGKLKDEVKKLKLKLKKYKRKLEKKKGKKEKKDHKKAEKEIVSEVKSENATPEEIQKTEDKKNKKIFRALVLGSVLGNNNDKLNPNIGIEPSTSQNSVQYQQQPSLTLTQQMSSSLPVPAQTQSLAESQIPTTPATPKLNPSDVQGLMLKHLTIKDFDKIAQRKLTVEKYQKLVTTLDGLTPEEKKQRYLSDILSFFPSLISDFMGMINNTANMTTSTMMNPAYAKTVSGLVLGTALGLKSRKNRKFMLDKSKMLKDIEMFNNMNAVIDDQKSNIARATDGVAMLVSRTKSITSNIAYRFSKKIEMFSVAPF